MRLVIIESPYAGDIGEVFRNIAYARAAMLDCFKREEAPYASHLLYTQVLDDNDPTERDLGIEAGLWWGDQADATVVYTDLGITPGMTKGIERAQRKGRNVEFRNLKDWM